MKTAKSAKAREGQAHKTRSFYRRTLSKQRTTEALACLALCSLCRLL